MWGGGGEEADRGERMCVTLLVVEVSSTLLRWKCCFAVDVEEQQMNGRFAVNKMNVFRIYK